MVMRLCITVALFCLPLRSIFPHTSLHDLPRHRTMMKKVCAKNLRIKQFCKFTISFRPFLRMTFYITRPRCNVCFGFFWKKQFLDTPSWHPGFKQIPVIVHNIFACFAFSLNATQKNMVNEWCWFSKSTSFMSVFQVGLMFCFFPANFLRPHTQTRLYSPRGNSRFEHGSVIVHKIFAYLALSLSASQVHMIQERCWFSQINFFIEYFPHRIKILFLSSQFHVIHIHR